MYRGEGGPVKTDVLSPFLAQIYWEFLPKITCYFQGHNLKPIGFSTVNDVHKVCTLMSNFEITWNGIIDIS